MGFKRLLRVRLNHMTAQLFAASFLRETLASFIPVKRFLLINDRCLANFGLSELLLLLAVLPVLLLLVVVVVPLLPLLLAVKDPPFFAPAEDSAATSITSNTLRGLLLAEVSEYTSAPMCLAVFKP